MVMMRWRGRKIDVTISLLSDNLAKHFICFIIANEDFTWSLMARNFYELN